jgi:hypothetical protein
LYLKKVEKPNRRNLVYFTAQPEYRTEESTMQDSGGPTYVIPDASLAREQPGKGI